MRVLGKFFTGFLLGGVLASLTVLLFTPISGDAMRARVKENMTNVRNEVDFATKARSIELREELARLQKKG